MGKILFLILFLCFSTSVFATPNFKPFQGSILVTNEKSTGAVCNLWIELGGEFTNFSSVETQKKHYAKKDENNTFYFNTYRTQKKVDNNGVTKEQYILDDYFNSSDLLVLYNGDIYSGNIWSVVKMHSDIFYEHSKFSGLEKRIISLLYRHTTNTHSDLLKEEDFYILKKLIELGHEQSKMAHEKYEKILKNHKLKQAAIFLSIACAILILLYAIGCFLYKYRKNILGKVTKTKTQRLGIIFFILILIFMFLEKGHFFYLDNEEYLFFILVPLAISFFMVFGITDCLYKWVVRKEQNND